MAVRTVAARSAAEIPVVTSVLRVDRHAEGGARTAWCCRCTASGSSSSSRRSPVIDRQIWPRPSVAMKLMTSGVTFSAATVRSPSFSRSSSSTTMIMRPSRNGVDRLLDGGERRCGSCGSFGHDQDPPTPCAATSSARSTYLPSMSHSRFTRSFTLGEPQVRVLPRVRDDLHVEVPVVDAGDRQADAVHRDRALPDDLTARATGGTSTVTHQASPSLRRFLDRAGRVDVPLHEVAADPARRRAAAAPGSPSVPRFSDAERRHARVSGRHVHVHARSPSAETTVRQTPLTARLSPGVSSGESGVVSAQPEPGRRRLDLRDFSERFNQSGEHVPVSGPRPARPRRARRAAILQRCPGQPARPDPLQRPGAPGAAGVRCRRGPRRRRRRPGARWSVGAPLEHEDVRPASRPARAARLRYRRPGGARMRAPRGLERVRRGPAARRRRPAVLTIMTGPASSVESTRAVGGVRSRRSKIDAGQRAAAIGAAGRQQRDRRRARSRIRLPSASTSARCRWTRRLAAGPVSRVRSPGAAAMRPSRLSATFRITKGRPRRRFGQEDARSGAPPRRAARRPSRRCRARAGRRRPAPLTSGFGSSIAMTARRMPASATSGAQGPVRPVWEHGSSVQ